MPIRSEQYVGARFGGLTCHFREALAVLPLLYSHTRSHCSRITTVLSLLDYYQYLWWSSTSTRSIRFVIWNLMKEFPFFGPVGLFFQRFSVIPLSTARQQLMN